MCPCTCVRAHKILEQFGLSLLSGSPANPVNVFETPKIWI